MGFLGPTFKSSLANPAKGGKVGMVERKITVAKASR